MVAEAPEGVHALHLPSEALSDAVPRDRRTGGDAASGYHLPRRDPDPRTHHRSSHAPDPLHPNVARPRVPDAALRAREWIFAQLRGFGWTESCLRDVALAVDEAVQNAVEHGSEPDAEIRVDLRIDDGAADVRVRDRGRPGAAPPTGDPSPPGDHAIRGRGRVIMSNLADVDWRPAEGGGTEVHLHFCADDDAEETAAV